MHIDIQTIEIERLKATLANLAPKAVAYAARAALTRTAYHAAQLGRVRVKKEFITRSRWTEGSVRYERATSLDLRRMYSTVGSTEEYMEKQEFGYVERKRGKHGVAIPTSAAAGQEGTVPRTKLVRPASRLPRIKLSKQRKKLFGRRRRPGQEVMIAVNVAVRDKQKFIAVDVRGSKRWGIYRIVGGRYRGHGWPGKAKLRMLHEISRPRIVGRPRPWLGPVVMVAATRMDDYMLGELHKQMERLR